jgi:hypothetical protein
MVMLLVYVSGVSDQWVLRLRGGAVAGKPGVLRLDCGTLANDGKPPLSLCIRPVLSCLAACLFECTDNDMLLPVAMTHTAEYSHL